MSSYDQVDDTRCCNCGGPIDLANIKAGGEPEDNGYCSQACEKGEYKHAMFKIIYDMLSPDLGEDPARWSKAIYNGSSCGAWLQIRSADCIALGSIVEGSDAEVGPVNLTWPFSKDDFWEAVVEIDNEASFYWDRDNSDWFCITDTRDENVTKAYDGRYCKGDLIWITPDTPSDINELVIQALEDPSIDPLEEQTIELAPGISITGYYSEATYG